MLVEGFPAGPWGTNCWVVAPAAGRECLVIDPGFESAVPLRSILAEHRLRPIAVLLTHGHIDHMWSVTPVSGDYGIPAYVHPADRYRLTDPWRGGGMPTGLAQQLGVVGLEFTEPDELRLLSDDQTIPLGELDVTISHTPGHTEGSVVFDFAGTALFTGDLLFAGSVGRTDLPGGDPVAMAESLNRIAHSMPEDVEVFPGHGPSTTIGHERRTNPYLSADARGGVR